MAGRAAADAAGLRRALGLTLASALLWGVAHLWAGRRVAGSVLMGLYVLFAIAAVVAATVFQGGLTRLAVQTGWLITLTVALLLLGLLWVAVVVRSYQLVRPGSLSILSRRLGTAAVAALCLVVATPLVWAAHISYVSQDTLSDIFQSGGTAKQINKKDPWNGRRRVNILLLGGDAGPNREGVRTDSMTLASVDTRTGDTVLLSLPRNLESFPMPPGPARNRFPQGFTGEGAQNPGLLNEVFEYAERHPDVVPGVPKKERGPALLMGTIGQILGVTPDYYVLVDMKGFAEIIDAMGGVRMKVTETIIYGRSNEGRVAAGDRVLSGTEALWFGRSRTFSDDYTRMGRQKCLLRAIAKQADPQRVLRRFDQLAAATRRAISTDIPADLLPALVDLSAKVRGGAKINSLQFVPPLINTGYPDFKQIRALTAKAIEASEARTSAAPSASPTPTTAPPRPGGSKSPSAKPAGPVSLDESCPS
jgi:polyisoprenyl-teichoic acid--peptidoglycan teichoic acid transferase